MSKESNKKRGTLVTGANEEKDDQEITYITFAKFLESNFLNQPIHISDLVYQEYSSGSGNHFLVINKPDLDLYCPHEECKRIERFRDSAKCHLSNQVVLCDRIVEIFIYYICSHCQKTEKNYSLRAKAESIHLTKGICYKYGEFPPYDTPISPKLSNLIDEEYHNFTKGKECENQGFGIGAFAYYRRVIESQKNRIIEEIIKVLEKLGNSDDKIKILKDAINETQFSKALEMAKDALPTNLLIQGNNPLYFLHKELSKGLHGRNDTECLESATDILVVLSDFSELLSRTLKDNKEVLKAFSKLMNPGQKNNKDE